MNYPPQGPPPQGPPPGNYGPPQGYPGQWGPPPQQPPWPQQQWSPGPPPKKRNGWKWALGAVAVLAVIGVTVAVTVSATSGDGGGDDPTPRETYGLASADDTGPVNIITEDPSCAAWTPIQTTLGNSLPEAWGERDPAISSASWTPDQRSMYDTAANVYREAAERAVPVVKVTPHRVIRELYEQFIVYSRAFAKAVPNYQPSDNHLVGVATATSGALGFICGAITYGSAEARAPFLSSPPPPTQPSTLRDPNDPEKFLPTSNSTCQEWDTLLHEFSADTKDWQALDARTPASAWTTEQRQVVEAVIPVMRTFADKVQSLGVASGNPIIEDFATLSAQYRRAYAEALPTYTSADSYLARAANRSTSAIFEACEAVEG